MIRVARERSTHPRVRALALNILEHNKIPSHDYLDEAKAIGEFVQQNVRYVRDIETVEQLHDPLYLIEKIMSGRAQGDCDDMSLLIATLLLSIGHSPKFAIVKYRNRTGPFNHIYVVVYERNWRGPRERLPIDAIIKDKEIGYEVPHVYKEEIDI